MRWNKPCSICSAPQPVRDAINAALTRGTNYREIEKEVGISRSSISRHSRKCIPRKRMNDFRDALRPVANGRLVIAWPNDECAPPDARGKFLYWGKELRADDLRENDTILKVEYAPLPTIEPEQFAVDVPRDPKPEPDLTLN
jgi:hypothetical protein